MSDHHTRDPIELLEATVAGDPGSSAFPALAEAYRRAGRSADAERVAREGLVRKPGSLPGVLALVLVLLDTGRAGEARRILERAAAEVLAEGAPPRAPDGALDLDGDVSDAELDLAFAGAETDRDEVLDADRVALEAMRGSGLEAPEDVAAVPGAPFETRTMADLLERQGDAAGAARIRDALSAPGRAADPEPPGEAAPGDRIVATLERWLENLRRGRS